MQTVFRIRPARKLQSQERFESEGPVSHRPRKAHKKSRRGCQNCKRRRVKCDENVELGCRNCLRHGVDCDFLIRPLTSTSSASTASSNRDSPITPTSMSANTPSTTMVQYYPAMKICASPGFASPLSVQQPDDLAPILQTLSFFETFTCSTVTTTDGLGIFKGSILALSHQCDYLMHAILGMAAAHLRAMNGIIENQQECQRFSKTESYHWHRAIGQYRAQLTNEAVQEHVDTLITTSMLLGLHNFQIASPDDTSFIHAPKSERQAKLRWLVIPMGFPAVLNHVRRLIDNSVWFRLFNSAVPADEGWTIRLDTAEGIYADFLDLCNITSEHDNDDNPYRRALMDLFALFQIQRLSMRDMAQVVAFMSRLNGDFQVLLVALDSRALLILLYWLTILDTLGLWWARDRAAQEAQAIIGYLEGSDDVRIQNLLRLPIETCLESGSIISRKRGSIISYLNTVDVASC